jgi:frataxin-like iron-binding protein CyaY
MPKFKDLAESTLDEIFNLVETKYDEFEVDFEDKNIRIESLGKNLVYILSVHEPTSQLWLSSPVSGAHHFELKCSNPVLWVSTRDDTVNLFEILEKELGG